jgi:hypothetical protein
VIGFEDRKQQARKGLVWRTESFGSIEEAPVTIRSSDLEFALQQGFQMRLENGVRKHAESVTGLEPCFKQSSEGFDPGSE